MEIVFTPWKLTLFLFSFSVCGFGFWLAYLKRYKLSIFVFFMLVLFAVFKPVKLSVNDAPIIRADEMVKSRFEQLPERISIAPESFAGVMEKTADKNSRENDAVESEVLEK